MWDDEKITQHKKAAKILDTIKNEAFDLIKKSEKISEYEVKEFILKKFKEYDLKTDAFGAIVAFGENTQYVHYFPSQYSKIIRPNTLIMIDIWARLNQAGAPFADITWMAYKGEKLSPEIEKVFKVVIEARDRALLFLKKSLKQGMVPSGSEVDAIAREYISEKGYGKNFKHTTGHSLGFVSAHGPYGRLSVKNKKRLYKNLGYTIEPGVYLSGKFGVRSEIDFYISDDLELKITTKIQKNIRILGY